VKTHPLIDGVHGGMNKNAACYRSLHIEDQFQLLVQSGEIEIEAARRDGDRTLQAAD
jgi:hypothetical protein